MTDDEGMAPVYLIDRLASTTAVVPPERPEVAERQKIRDAAVRVSKLFPGPVGTYLSLELASWESMGLRYDQKGVTLSMVNAILDMPIPETPKVV